MTAQDRVDSLAARLTDGGYELASVDFVRFRADPVDDKVATLVHAVTAEGAEGCQGFRDALDDSGSQTLRDFAQRRILHAHRTSSLSAIYEALDAVALAPQVSDVPWDSWVRASLVVAGTLGGDLGSMQSRFWDVASEESSNRFDIVVDAMDRVEGLGDCRIVEVRTTYGVGFLETLIIHDRTRRAIYTARRFPDREVAYAPESNLAQVAVEVADAVDATGRATTSPIGHDQLTASLFDLAVSGSYVATTGCLSFLVNAPEPATPVLVLVAELDPDEDVEALLASADEIEGQDVVADGHRLVVLSPQPTFDDEDSFDDEGPSDDEGSPDEDAPDDRLDELVEIARRALDDPATR